MDFFFITLNSCWAGSEILWHEAMNNLAEAGYSIYTAAPYRDENICSLRRKRIPFFYLKRRSLLPLRIQRYLSTKFPAIVWPDRLKRLLRKTRPRLVVISQGNNCSAGEIMQICLELGLRYITLTQLVTEYHFLQLKENARLKLKTGYANSLMNFFVSEDNKTINSIMMGGIDIPAKIINNPISTLGVSPPNFPSSEHAFRIAYVGRIEAFHKGLDLFIRVISADKWKKRPVLFTLYGSGPHEDWLRDCIISYDLKNVELLGPYSSLHQVWSSNHILLLPSRMEGQSLALLEALGSARSAVVTNVGGSDSVIEDGVTGFVAQYPSAESIDNALERAWDMREHWKQIGLKARQTLEHKVTEDSAESFASECIMLLR